MKMDTNLKLNELKESCKRLVQKDKEELEEKIKKEMNEQIMQEVEEYTNKQENTYQKKCEKLDKEYYKKIYEYETLQKKEIFEKIKEYNKKLTEDISAQIKKMMDLDIYEEYFWNLVKDILPKIDIKNSKIGLVKKDFERFSKKLSDEYFANCMIIDDSYIGGIIVESQEIFIDSTIKNSIEEEVRKKDLG